MAISNRSHHRQHAVCHRKGRRERVALTAVDDCADGHAFESEQESL
jgi:hypothetical protein